METWMTPVAEVTVPIVGGIEYQDRKSLLRRPSADHPSTGAYGNC